MSSGPGGSCSKPVESLGGFLATFVLTRPHEPGLRRCFCFHANGVVSMVSREDSAARGAIAMRR